MKRYTLFQQCRRGYAYGNEKAFALGQKRTVVPSGARSPVACDAWLCLLCDQCDQGCFGTDIRLDHQIFEILFFLTVQDEIGKFLGEWADETLINLLSNTPFSPDFLVANRFGW